MKCKNLSILLSIFVSNADLPESMLQDVKKLGSTNASFGRVEVGCKGLFHPNSLLVIGTDASFNPFLGVGYIQNMEYMGWPLEFKFVLYCFDWANKSFSKSYISKMPCTLSVSTNIWGFNFGASVAVSFNKKFLISAFFKFDLNDDYDVSLNYHAYGESDFFSKNSYSRAAIERLKKDSHKIVTGFSDYCKKINVPGEIQDDVINCFVEHAKQTERICDYFLSKNSQGLKKIKDAQSNSLFLIGKSGAGKTNTFSLLKDFVTKNNLYSISLLELNASSFTPEGYKGDNVNEKIANLFNENIKNSKNYKHNAVSIFRSVILVDEIDNISETNGGTDTDNFYARVQKVMLDFVEGKQLYKTDVGLIPVLGCLKILPGAFESKSGELERKVIKKILCENNCSLTADLTISLIDYIKANYIVEHSDCENFFKNLIDEAKYVDELITKELDKDPNFIAFKRGDKDKDLRSLDEIYKYLESNKIFSALKNPEIYKELEKFSQLVQDTKLKFKNIQTTRTKEKFSVDPTKFDDLYVRIIEKLESFSSDLDEKSNEILEVAVENYKRKSPLFCISESGMGGEIIRRAAKVFYLEKPSLLRSLKFLESSDYAKLLKKNKSNIMYLGCNSDDAEDSCIMALLQSAKGGKLNNNSKYSFEDLKNLSKKGIKDFNYAFEVNGKVIISIKSNDLDIRPNDLGSEDSINIDKVKELFNKVLTNLNEEIDSKKNSISSLNNVSSIKDYDNIQKILNNKNIEESLKELTEFVQNYRETFLKTKQFEAFCSSMSNIAKQDRPVDESELISKLQKLVESSFIFFEKLKMTNIIDDKKSYLEIVGDLQKKCRDCQKEANSEKLLGILTSLLSTLKKKNELLNQKKAYKAGSDQTIQERISELASDKKKKNKDVIDLYYKILSITSKK